jgi:predicted MFS family arabinose efflux permease
MMTSVVAGFILPDFGWRGMFWFGGGITLAMGFIAWTFIPESLKYLFDRRPADALERVNRILKKLGKQALSSLPAPAEAQTRESRGVVSNITHLLMGERRSVTLMLWAAFFLCFSSIYFLLSWIPRLMEQAGYSAEIGRLAFFLFNAGGVIGIFILGGLATYGRLTNLVFAFLFSSALCMVIFAMVPGQPAFLMVIIFLMGLFQQGGFTGLYAVAAKVYPTEVRSTGIGWAIGFGRSGAVVGPALAGVLIAAGLGMSGNYLLFAIPVAFGSLVAYRLKVQ